MEDYLNQIELAARWRISPRTLERWRWRRIGPDFIKVGGSVRYSVDEVRRFENERRRKSLGHGSPVSV